MEVIWFSAHNNFGVIAYVVTIKHTGLFAQDIT